MVNESGTSISQQPSTGKISLKDVFVYACGVPTCLCVYMWMHVCIGYIYMWKPKADINGFSVPLYFTYWGSLSHLKPELYNLTNVVSKLAPETPSVLLHVGVTGGMPYLPGIWIGARNLNSGPVLGSVLPIMPNIKELNLPVVGEKSSLKSCTTQKGTDCPERIHTVLTAYVITLQDRSRTETIMVEPQLDFAYFLPCVWSCRRVYPGPHVPTVFVDVLYSQNPSAALNLKSVPAWWGQGSR